MENITKRLSSLADEYAKMIPPLGLDERKVYTEVMGQLVEFFSLNPNDEQLQTIGEYLKPFIKDGVDYTELFQESRQKMTYQPSSREDEGSIIRAQKMIYDVINNPKSTENGAWVSKCKIWRGVSITITGDIEPTLEPKFGLKGPALPGS